MSQTAPQCLGPYRLEKLLGSGGMGEVYRAYDTRLERRVAIKHVRPDRASSAKLQARARLRREARLVASLNHPTIVQIYDILEHEEADWIVMELVDGPSVAALVQKGPLELPFALTLARDVIEGLAEAHEEGIIHRDLKTENVVVTPRQRAKILDFGLAKPLDTFDEEARLSVPGLVLGTCRAMAPEQAEGDPVSPLSDLFSYGTLLYEMLTGRSPFLGKTPGDTLQRIVGHRPPSVRRLVAGIPEELAYLVERLIAKSPSERPYSARAVSAELTAIAEVLPRPVADSEATVVHESTGAETSVSTPTVSMRRRREDHLTDGGMEAVAPSASLVVSGERRPVTVLSCELVADSDSPPGGIKGGRHCESPPHSPQGDMYALDPEDLLQLMPLFQHLVAEVVEPFGGRLEQEKTLHPSLTVLFGYPRAHADDARRATLAALEIRQALALARDRFEPLAEHRLAVRVGIDTGLAVVTAVQLALGEAHELASELRNLADPGAVVVSGSTWPLIKGSFICRRESITLSSPARPLTFYRVMEYGEEGQYQETGPGRLVDQVSRTRELEQILERWALARQGSGQVVLVSGDAGIGKTRLIKAVKGRLMTEPRLLIECRSTPYHEHTAFFPWLDFIDRVVAGEDLLTNGTETVESLYGDLPLARFLPRLAMLLATPRQSRDPRLGRGPEAQRQRTLESIAALLVEMSEHLPLVVVVEDLHWCDPSTLDLLTLLIDQVATSRILLLLSFRRRFEQPWGYPSHLSHVTLSRLGDEHVSILVDLLAEGREVSPAVRRQIIERADGIPLFVEELTRLFDDSDADMSSSNPAAIPATLQGWLVTRLDRLGTAKKLAQIASALGREFSHDLLREIAGLEDSKLERELRRLMEAEILHRRGLPPHVTYTFRHSLLREAAHESLLKSKRRKYHQRIANALERSFPLRVEREPEFLAVHYTEAGMTAKAVSAWRRAAEKAVREGKHPEASDHARCGLELLGRLDKPRPEDEMALQAFLGVAVSAARGYGSPEAEKAYARARELWCDVEKNPSLFPVLDNVALFYHSRGQIELAREMAEELVEQAEAARDFKFLPAAYWTLAWTLLTAGEFRQTKQVVDEGIAFYATQLSLEPNIPPGTGLDVATSLGDLSWALWFLGYPDQARQCCRNSLDLVENSSDDFSRAFALFRAAYLHVFLRDHERAGELAAELVDFSNRQGFLYLVGMGLFVQGQALVASGRFDEEGLSMMSGGLDGMWATGVSVGRSRNLAFLAEACGKAGTVEQGLSLIREAAVTSRASGEGHFEAEIERMAGELLLLRGDDDRAEDAFRTALVLARRQDSKILELRALTSLARLDRDGAVGAKALRRLTEVYAWFQEGFDTPDLVEARMALDYSQPALAQAG